MKLQLLTHSFDPWSEISLYQQSFTDLQGKYGATAVFVGSMRDFNDGDDVKQMILEHYPEMTLRHLEKIVTEAQQQWPILDILLLHRVGAISPDECIVTIAVWSAHRDAAFSACRYLIEELKKRAPFWKKEKLENNTSRWVDHNTP
jgi:molybdopterin synthase catalytic subunit